MAAPAVVDLELAPLSVADAPGLFAFEVKNRKWFESHVGPRPDAYWDLASLTEIVRDQVEAGEMMFLLKSGGKILGRLNLTAVDNGVAQLGYRIGQHHTGQGIATRAVALALQAAQDRGLWALEARVLLNNPASIRVLEKAGFIRTGQDIIGDLECETYRSDLDQD
ncbi:GNAT family N-acetyltransferase [Aliiroseovarius sp. S1339]|uniref:GNAT family N-acetyltransferase n=1 Tax=Aliiroseovarius sp. S1339 TaxID=2936990 RepID=UPI0020BEC191|nr:GNAT family N-acetyltransferase [Aliiroseovarius sp. S1339]MCK8464222.1 GNAT family N-acetyltransferase [Aliiroseovarius sp. S1339]